jgi:hypothetical protein
MIRQMASLREKMGRHGFESNDDYEFQVRCLLERPTDMVRALNVQGDSERRKTAFASALAHALDFPHILYYDFTQQKPLLPDVILPPSKDELGREEPPIDPLDQVVSEACALSEADPTVLILDQLQAADFRDHLRLYRLICDSSWAFRDARYDANPKHLLVFLISEEGLYHSLQKVSFRVWVSRVSEAQIRYDPAEFGLGPQADGLFAALAELFRRVGAVPTRSEFQNILRDIHLHVRSADDLRHCLYGWSEGIDRNRLQHLDAATATRDVLQRLEEYLGSEAIEIGGDPAG